MSYTSIPDDIYMLLDPVSSCEADNWEISNDAGTAITFSGCDFIAYLNPSSMITDQITTITYWEEVTRMC